MLGNTGAVTKMVPHLASAASKAAMVLWDSCDDRQLVLWLDN